MAALLVAAIVAAAVGFGIGRLLSSRVIPTIYLLVGTVALGLLTFAGVEAQRLMAEDQGGVIMLFWGVVWGIFFFAPTVGALLGYWSRQR